MCFAFRWLCKTAFRRERFSSAVRNTGQLTAEVGIKSAMNAYAHAPVEKKNKPANSLQGRQTQRPRCSTHWLRSYRTSSYVTGEDHHDAPSTQDTNRYPSKLCEPSVHCCVTCEDQHDVPSSNAKNAAETFKNTHTHTQAEAYTQKHKYTQTNTHTYTCKTQTQLQDKHTHTHTHTRAYSQNHTLRRITHFLHLWVMSLRSPKIRIFCGYVQIWIWHFVDFGAMLHRS